MLAVTLVDSAGDEFRVTQGLIGMRMNNSLIGRELSNRNPF